MFEAKVGKISVVRNCVFISFDILIYDFFHFVSLLEISKKKYFSARK